MKYRNYSLLALLAVFLMAGFTACSQDKKSEPEEVSVIMFKNPGCQCCDKWAMYMEEKGFSVNIEEPQNMPAVKRRNGIPYTLESCHTSLIGDYVVEGHVPAEDVKKLLEEQPDARGIAVPGMPTGSPGMEIPGRAADPYNVYLFDGQNNAAVFSSH